ncbi:MAG: hypothetical protein IJP92_02905 [Lachnospiraceae bacterium]|nr:hypothetical protein [Lachnospiraceae bacterium]
MEYKDRIPVKRYRPQFGYGYNPEDVKKKKTEEDMTPVDGHQTMPRPADSPLITLIAVVILWLAFFIGAVVATRLEVREVTDAGGPVQTASVLSGCFQADYLL